MQTGTEDTRLLVVSGPPGSGKSTLAREVGAVLGWPVISRDEIKQGMAHGAPPGFRPGPGDELTRATLGAFFDVLTLLVERGVSVVAEAAFQHKLWAPGLEPLTAQADVRVVRCMIGPEAARERVTRRAEQDSTRVVHADAAHLSAPPGEFVPVSLLVPTLDVDTTDGYRPAFSGIVDFATHLAG